MRKYYLLSALVLASLAVQAQSPNPAAVTSYRYPTLFTANEGQWNRQVLYAALKQSNASIFTKQGITFISQKEIPFPESKPSAMKRKERPEIESHVQTVEFVRPSKLMTTEARNKAVTVSNFYLGNDSNMYREGVSNYKSLRYKNVWRNIDVEYTEGLNGVQQTIAIAPGGKLSDVKMRLLENESNHDGFIKTQQAYQLSNSNRIPVDVKLRQSGKLIEFDASAYDPTKTLYLPGEFSTYFGGTALDFFSSLFVDQDDDVVASGITASINLPVINAHQSQLSGVSDLFIVKYSVQNKSLRYCTFFGGSMHESIIDLCQGETNSSIISGYTSSSDFPTTSDGAIVYKTNHFISRLSSEGILIYSSYLWDENIENWFDMTTDRDGAVYFSGHTYKNPPFLTPNALMRHQGSEDGLILKLSPKCDSILYATCIGGPGHEEMGGIAVDNDGNIFVFGNADRGYPMVNAHQSTIAGGSDVALSKIACDGSKLIFSTYIGGTQIEYTAAHSTIADPLVTDAYGNVYITGNTTSFDFPEKQPLPNPFGRSFISKFSPTGELLYSTKFFHYSNSSYNATNISSIATDLCGRIFISGSIDAQELPMISPIQTLTQKSSKNFIAIIDSSGNTLSFSTHWGYRTQDRSEIAVHENNVYFGGTTSKVDSVPIFNAYESNPIGNNDIFLSGIQSPICSKQVPILSSDSLECHLSGIDSLLIERTSGLIFPSQFSVTLRLVNRSKITFSKSIPIGLQLSPQLRTIPSDASRFLVIPSIAPGDSVIFTWMCYFVDDQSKVNKVNTSITSAFVCTSNWMHCKNTIRVIRFDYRIPLACSLSSIDSLHINPQTNEYFPTSLDVHYSLKYLGSGIGELRHLKIELPFELETVPPNDLFRVVPLLATQDSFKVSWKLRAKKSRWFHSVSIKVLAVDTLGILQSICEKSIVVSPFPIELVCRAHSSDTIRFNWLTQQYEPSLQFISFDIRNILDTMQSMIIAKIDLSKAPHIHLHTNEPDEKGYNSIPGSTSITPTWRVNFDQAQSGLHTEIIKIRFRGEYSFDWHECEYIIVFEKKFPGIQLSCLLATPDSLHLDTSGLRYIDNPFTISYTLRNNGIINVPLQYVELESPQNLNLTLIGSARKSISLIQRQDSLTELWSIRAQPSRYRRDASFIVSVVDTGGTVILRCERKVVIPPTPDALICSVTGIDTVRFIESTRTYEPNPIPISLLLENKIDTIQSVVEAMIDLQGASFIDLVQGETLIKSIPEIDVASNASRTWNLRVRTNPKQLSGDTIIFKYRNSFSLEWKECRYVVMIQPETEQKYAKASCIALGQDSVWYDHKWERYIPDPILVTYTITNTGTMTLSTCNAAIILPKQFSLATGTDSIQTYSPIQPGRTITRSWLLVPTDIPQDTTVTISWQWSCKEFAGDTTCTHKITLTTKDPNGLVITPWHLKFRAEQLGPLPLRQQVTLWTSLKSLIPWQTNMTMSWLTALPSNGDKEATIDVQPTTTNLPLGIHSGLLSFTPSAPFKQIDIGVEYEIYSLTQVPNTKFQSALTLEQNYPNPVVGGQGSVIAFTIPTAGNVELKVFDLLGREVTTLLNEHLASGSYQVRLTQEQLGKNSSGLFFYVLRVNGRESKSRAMVVRE